MSQVTVIQSAILQAIPFGLWEKYGLMGFLAEVPRVATANKMVHRHTASLVSSCYNTSMNIMFKTDMP